MQCQTGQQPYLGGALDQFQILDVMGQVFGIRKPVAFGIRIVFQYAVYGTGAGQLDFAALANRRYSVQVIYVGVEHKHVDTRLPVRVALTSLGEYTFGNTATGSARADEKRWPDMVTNIVHFRSFRFGCGRRFRTGTEINRFRGPSNFPLNDNGNPPPEFYIIKHDSLIQYANI